jgi:ABC-type antimicrobial peptide transport system permease subunit
VVWLVLRQGLGLVVAGLVAGIAKSLVVTTLMSGLLFDTPATDTLTFVGVAGLLVFIATAACLLPARRALSIDAVQALRRN